MLRVRPGCLRLGRAATWGWRGRRGLWRGAALCRAGGFSIPGLSPLGARNSPAAQPCQTKTSPGIAKYPLGGKITLC